MTPREGPVHRARGPSLRPVSDANGSICPLASVPVSLGTRHLHPRVGLLWRPVRRVSVSHPVGEPRRTTAMNDITRIHSTIGQGDQEADETARREELTRADPDATIPPVSSSQTWPGEEAQTDPGE